MKLAASQWECGVCGYEITHAAVKTPAQEQDKTTPLRSASSIVVE